MCVGRGTRGELLVVFCGSISVVAWVSAFLPSRHSWTQAGALMLTVAGSCLYSTGETSWTRVGLGLLLANTVLSPLWRDRLRARLGSMVVS